MYLKTIKLAGFKSFVDPTVIPIKSNMNAIVGPNGCGKSNVVDAIRWVIGETSAKQLRGQSMSDVIFNGTTSRKPVGKALTELVFDNSDGRIVGEYAKYNEIAIRREVERDGQSSYYLNGTACRRRDIVDIFLGTGLGPRSYSIIEQGMVSQLIEAKPDELRVYFEEAAGISKYKERRRETENRMHRTQENLDRLNDLRQELEKQLRHLKRQANAAQRYKEFKEEQRLLSVQTKALQWQDYAEQLSRQHKIVEEHHLALERVESTQQQVQADIDKGKVTQADLTEQQNEVQKRYYGLGAQIARLEQQIQHTQERITQWQSELEQTQALWQELSDNTLENQEQISDLTQELEQLSPQSSQMHEQAAAAKRELAARESAMQRWQDGWDALQAQMSKTARELEVARTKIAHYQQQQQNLEQRIVALNQNQTSEQVHQLSNALSPLSQSVSEKSQQLENIKDQLVQKAERMNQRRSDNQTLKQSFASLQQQLQQLREQYASLEAVQAAALGGDDQPINEWLSEQQLSHHLRLGKALQVESGWEMAVETVLAGYFDSVCVDHLANLSEQLVNLQGHLTLIAKSDFAHSAETHGDAPTLASKIQSEWPLNFWLEGVYVANDLLQAKHRLSQLKDHESIITRDGIWLGKYWLRVTRQSDSQGSILLREQQLKQLKQEIEEIQAQLDQQKAQLTQGEQVLTELELERDALHQAYQSLSSELTKAQSELSAAQSKLSAMQQQQQRIEQEISQIQQQLQQIAVQQEQAQQFLQMAQTVTHEQEHEREQYLAERESCKEALNNARHQAQQTQQRVDEWQIRVSSNENQLNVLQQTYSREQRQLLQLEERRETLSLQLQEGEAPLLDLKDELQTLLTQRLSIEKELHAAQDQLSTYTQQLDALEKQREQLSQQHREQQSQLEKIRIEHQTIAVRQTTIAEQIKEMGFATEEVIAQLPEEAQINAWEQRVAELVTRIERLGPINLAAIEEYDTTQERKEYLDKQNADLEEALAVLKEAIHKIDRETRAKFKDTYDRVNLGFQTLFPKIFGGGRAYLELSENDLLTTGVVIKAQPPGKRNASVHLLSGGEKALTAIALVFAIFQLNPAPFCVLDEVDAPLDDANVGRFCDLVKSMSDKTQFIIISHNKVTIGSADHLMGVTMQEAGVSRMVSVDVQDAIAMAEA